MTTWLEKTREAERLYYEALQERGMRLGHEARTLLAAGFATVAATASTQDLIDQLQNDKQLKLDHSRATEGSCFLGPDCDGIACSEEAAAFATQAYEVEETRGHAGPGYADMAVDEEEQRNRKLGELTLGQQRRALRLLHEQLQHTGELDASSTMSYAWLVRSIRTYRHVV